MELNVKKYFVLSLLMTSLVGCAANIVYTGDLGKETTHKGQTLYGKGPLSDEYAVVATGKRIEKETISKDREFVAYITTAYEGGVPALLFKNALSSQNELICELADTNIKLEISDSKLLVGYSGLTYPIDLPSFGRLDEPLPFCVMSSRTRKDLQERQLREAEQKRTEEFNRTPEGKLQLQEQAAKAAEVKSVCKSVAQSAADAQVLQVVNVVKSIQMVDDLYSCMVLFSSGLKSFVAEINYNTTTGRYAIRSM